MNWVYECKIEYYEKKDQNYWKKYVERDFRIDCLDLYESILGDVLLKFMC